MVPRGEAHQLFGLDEDDVGEDPCLPVTTTSFLQRHSGRANDYAQFTNGKPPRWSLTRPSQHIRSSLERLFGPVRSLLCPTTTRTVCTIGLLMFMLCFAFCITSEPHPGPEARKTEPSQGLPIENTIFKVCSILFQARNDTDAFICRMCWNSREPCHNMTSIYLFLKGEKDGMWFAHMPAGLALDTLRRYINFSAHTWGRGWNNVLQEQYVFESPTTV